LIGLPAVAQDVAFAEITTKKALRTAQSQNPNPICLKNYRLPVRVRACTAQIRAIMSSVNMAAIVKIVEI
jgi:hypothetical protein